MTLRYRAGTRQQDVDFPFGHLRQHRQPPRERAPPSVHAAGESAAPALGFGDRSSSVVILAPIGTASAQEGLRFRGDASAAQEVQDPPVESEGLATGKFTFARDQSELEARVDVEGLSRDVTAAHLHCAIAGVTLADNYRRRLGHRSYG